MASFADYGTPGDQHQQIDALKKIIKERDAAIARLELQHRYDVITMADISDLGERESQQIDALKTTIEGRDATIATLKQHHRHDLQDAAKAVAVLKAKGYSNAKDVPGRIKVQRAIDKEKAETHRLRDANAELRDANDELQVVLADTSEKDAIIEKLRQDAQVTPPSRCKPQCTVTVSTSQDLEFSPSNILHHRLLRVHPDRASSTSLHAPSSASRTFLYR
jgi:hypothetical protein